MADETNEHDPDAITLDEFVAQVVHVTADFAAMWRREQAADHDEDQVWPERMGLADWWEQLIEHDPDEEARYQASVEADR